ncbi:MAG: sugar phosphate isomerase/epimerase [Bryobacteraceae bacterium]|nr:sugar phosphate isomerase/epimerase [Bryobacteraceae bacterium]
MASVNYSRRSFLATSLSTSLAVSAASSLSLSAKGKKIPIGLELYSVRDVLPKDLPGTLRAVAKQGYEVVEFYGSYVAWTPEYAKEVRKILDETGLKCSSTHNGGDSFSGAGLQKAIDLNSILGSKYIVMAHPGREIATIDGWKEVATTLNQAATKFKAAGIKAGYHNHDAEWRPIGGVKPIEVLAKNTDKDVMLQLDVGTCVATGNDPVAWIKANPGRIRSLHLKEWSPEKEYKVLFGEGKSPWKEIFAAAEKVGGVEFYLIEQEGYNTPSLETVETCLANFKKIHG